MPNPRLPARLALTVAALGLSLAPLLVRAQEISSDRRTPYPLTVTDDSGATVTFRAPPHRIVSLSPGHTETLFALGSGDRLIAVDTYSTYPAAARTVQPRLTTYPTPSIETIVSLQPDLVLSLVESDAVLQQLRQQGIPTLKLFPRDFDAALGDITEIGQVLDRNDQAQTLTNSMRDRRDTIVQTVAGAPRPHVFYEMDASDPAKPFTAGPKGFYGQLVDLAGGDNVFSDVPRDFAQVSAETVIGRDPDLILLMDGYAPFNPQSPAMVAARPGWEQVTAVRDGALYTLQAEPFSSPGPRLIDALETLAYLLHPDRFASSGGPHLDATNGSAPFCPAGSAPAFSFGFAALSDTLGTIMGDPTECDHGDPTTGDTYQQTAKGLAIYRKATNTPLFTNGANHWALTSSGVVQWSGDGLVPPATAQP